MTTAARSVLLAVVGLAALAPAAHASFGIAGFTAQVQKADTSLETQAGSHPFVGITSFTFNTTGATLTGT